MGREKYLTEEERKEAKREYMKQYRQKHKEEIRQYYQDNKEKLAEYQKQYRQTPMGRANKLLGRYRHSDKETGRGECTLTAQWIVDNIFTKKCAHCEKTGWDVIGCNRLDNSLPHTPENVEPCCLECNKKLGAKFGGRPKKTP